MHPDIAGDHRSVAMSRVEENDNVEMISGEGKEEVVQLNGAGAARASPCSRACRVGVRAFFVFVFFLRISTLRAIDIG